VNKRNRDFLTVIGGRADCLSTQDSFWLRALVTCGTNVTSACIAPLREKLDDSRFEVVHRACNFYAACGFEVSKHRALFANVGDSQ
jgi:hypothetical protein